MWQLALCAGLVWNPTAATGPSRAGHASARTSDGVTWAFGGLDKEGRASANMWKKATEACEWMLVEDTGDGPSSRMYASLTWIDDETMVLCGGWDPAEKGSGGVFYDDIWTFHASAERWTRSACSLPDGPVSRHTAHRLNDGRVLLQTFKGSAIYCPKEDRVERRATTGESPMGLSMQSGSELKDRVVLFGGATSSQTMTSNVYVLNTTTWHWTCFQAEHGPSPRASSCMAPLADSSGVLVFGGAGIADAYDHGRGLVPTNEAWILRFPGGGDPLWAQCDASIGLPAPRVAAIMERTDSSFTIHGGWDPGSGMTFDDTWTLEV